MKDKFQESYSPEVQEKTKKNLVWIIVFSITMMFAGFTSAYIVSMGDNFWVKVGLPTPFYVSTVLIIVSSITLILATKAAKQNQQGKVKLFVVLTLILGILFGVFQFQGYKALVDKGAMFNTWIIVNDGRYGDYFEIKKDNEYIEVDNNQYALNGEVLEGKQLTELQNFMRQFLEYDKNQLEKVDYNTYSLLFKGEPLSLTQGTLQRQNGESLPLLDYERLQYLAQNVVDNRADFFMKGEMGKDFILYYKGKELDYKNRTLMYNGQELSKNLQNKLMRGNKDTSTAYLYIITFLHLLHVIAGIIMLINYTRGAFTGTLLQKNGLVLRSGSIFWHFLGVLWIYLLLFLVFIH